MWSSPNGTQLDSHLVDPSFGCSFLCSPFQTLTTDGTPSGSIFTTGGMCLASLYFLPSSSSLFFFFSLPSFLLPIGRLSEVALLGAGLLGKSFFLQTIGSFPPQLIRSDHSELFAHQASPGCLHVCPLCGEVAWGNICSPDLLAFISPESHNRHVNRAVPMGRPHKLLWYTSKANKQTGECHALACGTFSQCYKRTKVAE